jgi:hypothetical protein
VKVRDRSPVRSRRRAIKRRWFELSANLAGVTHTYIAPSVAAPLDFSVDLAASGAVTISKWLERASAKRWQRTEIP